MSVSSPRLASVLSLVLLAALAAGHTASAQADPEASATPIVFRASASVGGAASSNPAVAVPAAVQPGDVLLLAVSNGSSRTPAPPTGWNLLDTRIDDELRTDVLWRLAAASDPGSRVTVVLRNATGTAQSAPNTLTLAAYSGVLTPPIAAYAASIETRTAQTGDHRTPDVTVPQAGSWVVSYWADRTSNTTTTKVTTAWTAPAGQTSRAQAYNTATGGRVTSLLTDDAVPAAAGVRSGLVAVADGQTRKATMWSIVLSGSSDPGPDVPPTARFTSSCVGLVCTFDASASTTPSGSLTSYSWDFGDGSTGGGVTTGHTYAAAGSYVVTLTVRDSRDLTAETTRTLLVSEPPDPSGEPPNILLINTDDQRYPGTLEVMPTVRSYFGDGGTEFTNGAVTTALCCPSRSSLFSGRYSHNTGITGNGLTQLVAEFDQASTMQGYLQRGGYNTAIVGKFLNTYPLNRAPENWNRWAVFTGGYNDKSFNVNGTVRKTTGYYSHRMGDFATQFLRDFETQDDKPWLLYMSPQAPHSDFIPEAKYANAPVPADVKPPSWNEADVSDKPTSVKWRKIVTEDAYQERRTQMLRTLMSVDDLVARVVAEMEALGEDSNTLAVFTSDNGYLWAEHRIMDKRFPYLESVEVPFLLRWPGKVAAGATSPRLVTQVDLLPTFLEAAGVQPALTYPLDGRSILSAPPREEVLLEYFKSADSGVGPWASIRGELWQYIEWYDVTTGAITFREYYDLAADPYQLTNVLADGVPGNEPDVATLHDRLTTARTCAGAACP